MSLSRIETVQAQAVTLVGEAVDAAHDGRDRTQGRTAGDQEHDKELILDRFHGGHAGQDLSGHHARQRDQAGGGHGVDNGHQGGPQSIAGDWQHGLVAVGPQGSGTRAIAMQLADRGIHVIAAARDIEAGRAVVGEIVDARGSAEAFALDVVDAAQCQAVFDHVTATHGRLDILVNNAGVALDKWIPGLEVDLDLLRQTMEVNVYGPLRLCQLFIPLMQQRRHGRVVNLSTELASLSEMEMGYTVAYRSAKAALNAVTKMLSLELKEYPDILVNAAAPGWVKTELGGGDAARTPEEGADTPVWLATLPADGPTGGFFRDRESYAW